MDAYEHWIGVRMAAGYGQQDYIDVLNLVAGLASVEQVASRSSAPELPQGAVDALRRIAAIDYDEPGITPVVFRLRGAVAIARSAIDTSGGR